MLVYRIASKEEIDLIFNNKSMDKVGNTFRRDYKINKFNYMRNIKYIHFYKEIESFLYLYRPKGCYLCIYDIDEELLSLYKGVGFYLDLFFLRNMVQVDEYAIPSNFIKFDNLVQVEELTGYIDIENFADSYNNSSVLKYKKR